MNRKKQKHFFGIFEILLSVVFFACLLIALFDIYVLHGFVEGLIAGFRNSLLTRVMFFFTIIGNWYLMAVIFLALLILLFAFDKKKSAYFLSVSMAAGLALSHILKIIVQRARPEFSIISESGYSFPSQHATMSAILFLVILYSFKEDINDKKMKGLFIFVCIFMFLVIGFSRVYLGVHFLSDVIGGWALGILVVKFIRHKFFGK
jgi:undecaprenyl-diphosphatase